MSSEGYWGCKSGKSELYMANDLLKQGYVYPKRRRLTVPRNLFLKHLDNLVEYKPWV